MRLNDVVEMANEKHMKPWNDLCQQHNINSTPLTPYISSELLDYNHLYIDGSKIESTGFTYSVPTIDSDVLIKSIKHAIESNIFPSII